MAAKLLGLNYDYPGTREEIKKKIRKLQIQTHTDKKGPGQCFVLTEIARDALEKALNQRGVKYSSHLAK